MNLTKKLDDEQAYDRINQDKIDEILAKPGQGNDNANPTNREEHQTEDDQPENAVTNDEDDATIAKE
jgi:hypothetical protein